MTTKHFEELWEEAEGLYKDPANAVSIPAIIAELIAKLSVYRALDTNDKITSEEKTKLKAHTFGKILSAMTHLSLKDEINSYAALKLAIDDLRIDQLELKYKV